MLYRVGTERGLATMESKLPKQVCEDLCIGVVMLDSEYGADRDYLQEGGYSLIVRAVEDLAEFKSIIDYEKHPCEWAVKESRNCGDLCALYIMNDDLLSWFICHHYCTRSH